MAEAFSVNGFYDSARDFARTALEAHHAENYRRVALDAGTALEHLAKACLVNRSPALLVADLKNLSAVNTLAWLLRVNGAKPVLRVRTVGLWDALVRVRLLVPSMVTDDDLKTLVDMRDGVVHAAQEAEMETQVLTAFIQQAETLLADLGRERAEFWAGQLGVVNALLTKATDEIAYEVAVKLAAAKASYSRDGTVDPREARKVRLARRLSKSALHPYIEGPMRCPVCPSNGVAIGEYDVDFEADDWDKDTGDVANVAATVWFVVDRFYCSNCGLRLDNPAELAEAKVTLRWEIEGASWIDYVDSADYDDEAYEGWREQQTKPEGL